MIAHRVWIGKRVAVWMYKRALSRKSGWVVPGGGVEPLITDGSDEEVLNPYRSQGIEVKST
jgi:hypothetical protein